MVDTNNPQEIKEIMNKYAEALSIQDYKEARKINDEVYEGEFNRYLDLNKKRREHISQGGGQYSYLFAIKEVSKSLEILLERGLKLVNKQHRSTQL